MISFLVIVGLSMIVKAGRIENSTFIFFFSFFLLLFLGFKVRIKAFLNIVGFLNLILFLTNGYLSGLPILIEGFPPNFLSSINFISFTVLICFIFVMIFSALATYGCLINKLARATYSSDKNKNIYTQKFFSLYWKVFIFVVIIIVFGDIIKKLSL